MGLAFAGMLMASCADSPTAVADYQVVPMPLEITAASQGSFLLKSGETICYTAGNDKMKKNAEFLAAFIKEQTGIALKVAEGDGEEGIVLRLGLEADSPEAYQLKVDDRKVVIAAPRKRVCSMASRRSASRCRCMRGQERWNCRQWKSTTRRASATVV